MKTKLRESQTPRKGKALLITEGQGTSGQYSAEVLQRDGANALPAGTKIYYNHLGNDEAWERNGSRDIRDLIGTMTEAAAWDEESRGLTAPIEIFGHAQEFVDNVWEHVGLSVEASGVVSGEGVVEALVYSPLNAVALVPVPGRGGKIQGLFESFREKCGSIDTDDSDERKELGMTPEDVKNAVKEAFAEFGPTLTTALTEALKPAEIAPVEEDADKGEDTATVAEALVEANLPAAARTKVYEAVANGTPVADAIAAEKEYIAGVLKESAKDEGLEGRVRESGTGTPRALQVWG